MKSIFVKRYVSQRSFDNNAVRGIIMALNVIQSTREYNPRIELQERRPRQKM